MELVLLVLFCYVVKKCTDAENIWDTFHMHPDQLYADNYPIEKRIV